MIQLVLALCCLPDVAPNPVPRSGETIAPRKPTAVEMSAETVRIWLQEDTAKIEASFVLRNTGTEKEDLEVGFPTAAQPRNYTWNSKEGMKVTEWGPSTIENFQATVDGQAVKPAPKSSTEKNAYQGWLCWLMSFDGGQKRDVKVSYTVHTRDDAYSEPGDLVRALARRLNAEARELAKAGAELLQIDEPFLAGYPDQVELAIEAVNIVTDGVPATWALHVCYGNRYARPSWEGHYDFLFPAVKAARVDQVVLEFARKGLDDLRLIRQHGWDKWLGLGVIDVKNPEVEAAELVASRIRRALEYVPAERLMINPDCGLRHLAPDVARQKLRAMVAGVALVRAELPGGQTS